MRPIALVTGGSRGIGLGVAKSLAQAGFDLAINGIRAESETETVMKELSALGAQVLYCRGNVAIDTDRIAVIDQVRKYFGALHLLVNNAGMAPRERRDILDSTEASFDEVVAANLKGTYFMSQLAARWMIEQKAKDPAGFYFLINVSSISATTASVNRGEYCISKAGIAMVTRLFATRLGEYDIPVYEIRPGIIETDMTSGVKEKYDRLIAEGICLQKRWGKPADIGDCVKALAEGLFRYSTGQVFTVDGGLQIERL